MIYFICLRTKGSENLQYIITFLQGIVSFVAPCVLPLLPVYISYIAGQGKNKTNVFVRSLFFVLGFTFVYTVFGLFAGTLGAVLIRYEKAFHIACGIILIFLGLNFLKIIKIPFLKGIHKDHYVTGNVSAFIFGVIFSVSHLPCIGALLGSALTVAAHSGNAVEGVLLLIVYSLGMGIPFLLSAVLIEKLKTIFEVINKNYKTVNIVCGIVLILLGIAMATGLMHNLICTH